MSFRSRRAHRELVGYIERIYGPQPALAIREIPREGVVRVHLSASDTVTLGLDRDPDRPPTYAEQRQERAVVELVEDLAARLVGIRSVRYSPGGGLVPEDENEGAYELHADFGLLFPVASIQVGVAWQELVRAGAEVLRKHDLLDGLKSSQIKSKFASLRWYLERIPEENRKEVGSILKALELLSTVVCEFCGAPGEHRKGGWHTIRCDDCQAERDRQTKKRGG